MDLPYIPASAATESTAAETEALGALLTPLCDRGGRPTDFDADLAAENTDDFEDSDDAEDG